MSEELLVDDKYRNRIETVRGKPVFCVDGIDGVVQIERGTGIVHRWIASIGTNGVIAELLSDSFELLLDKVVCFDPGDGFPSVRGSLYGLFS